LSAFQAATGQESHGIQADPKWVNPSAGDFHLQGTSPAIDSANSAAPNQPLYDFSGNPRVDDAAVSNTGAGPRTYDDRGALELQPQPPAATPPTAQLAVTPASGNGPLQVTADASGSTAGSSPIATYSFDFGDGTAATGPQAGATATHTYTSIGVHTVTVTVTDTRGLASTTTQQVLVRDAPPSASLTVTPSSGPSPLQVSADASASAPGSTPIATYKFDFGDGSAAIGPQTGPTASHTYSAPGTYTVTMTVTDTAGSSSTATRQVTVTSSQFQDAPPAAALAVTPSAGTLPLQVSADASASTDNDLTPIASYTFSFGDGSAAIGPQSGAAVSHTYATAGAYTVTVTVTDTAGNSSIATQQVTVSPPHTPPAAKLTVTPGSGIIPMAATADASGSSDSDGTAIASYKFNFGDGTPVVGPQAGATASHTYTTTGTYTVTVTVTDALGYSTTVTRQVSAYTNLVTNSGFEANLTGWNTSGSSAGITLTQVAGGHSGSFAAKLTNTNSTTASTCLLNDSPNWVAKTSAGQYTGSLWVRAETAGATLNLRFKEWSSSGALLGQNTTSVKLTTSWQLVSVTLPVTSPGSTFDFNAYVNSAAAGACFYADDATIYNGSPLENAPNATLTATPASGFAPLQVKADASASSDTDSTPIATYTFDFGDGSPVVGPQAAATTTHTYTAPGPHTIKVTVTDTAGNASSTTTQVIVGDGPPAAALNLSPTSGTGPLQVTADASGSSDPDTTGVASYTFDFGDGSPVVGPQSSPTATHLYTSLGTHTVTVTVTDSAGNASSTSKQVLVTDAPPTAALTVTPNSGTAPLHVTADASGSTGGSTPIANYSFDFGDGSPIVGPQTGATAAHTYTTTGTYTVKTTVTDTTGNSSSTTTQVTVNAPPDQPPAAVLTVTPSSGNGPLQVTADASGSTDTDATPIVSYTFNFGDGSPVIGPQPGATAGHTYTTPGTYTVTMTATDTAGNASTATQQVTVSGTQPPNAALSVTPTSGTAPVQVSADASASTAGSAAIASYTFNFGDGSSAVGPQAAATASHTYTTAGTYTVMMTVTDTAGNSSIATTQVTVSAPPDAPPAVALKVSPTSGTAPLQVTADASGSTDTDSTPIATYKFNFGDGSAAVGPQAGTTASHTYNSPGTYTVTTTVTDTAGNASTATQQVTVTQPDLPPAAALSVSPASGLSPLAVTADASASIDTDATPIATYKFNFGDGSAAVGPQAGAIASHTYTTAGTYTVTATVTDTVGNASTVTKQVTVYANLVGNPGFEINTSGWNTSGSDTGITLGQVAGGHSGSFAAKLANTSTTNATCTLNDSPNWVAKTSSGQYTGSLWVRADTAGATLNLRLREYSSSGTLLGSKTASIPLSTSWQQVTATLPISSPGSSLDYNAYVTKAAPGTCFYADDAVIYNG
jgi:PKD repeat protein